MIIKEFVSEWKKAFARGVPKEVMKERVEARGNMLRHVFTWGRVPCLEGEAANAAFTLRKEKTNNLLIKRQPRLCVV